MVYQPGCRHLEAWQALDYVRQRDMLANGDGDYGRQRHQQQFIKALLKEGVSKGMSNPLTLNTFLEKVSKAFIFDGGGVSLTGLDLRDEEHRPELDGDAQNQWRYVQQRHRQRSVSRRAVRDESRHADSRCATTRWTTSLPTHPTLGERRLGWSIVDLAPRIDQLLSDLAADHVDPFVEGWVNFDGSVGAGA